MTDPREPYGRLAHDTRVACEADRAAAEGRQRFNLGGWEDRSEHQRELDMAMAAEVAAAERERIAGEIAALREALKRHAHAFTDPRGAVLCGGCLQLAPCPDAALIPKEPS